MLTKFTVENFLSSKGKPAHSRKHPAVFPLELAEKVGILHLWFTFFLRTGNSTQQLNTREAHEYISTHWEKV